jgi:hypothetical protein
MDMGYFLAKSVLQKMGFVRLLTKAQRRLKSVRLRTDASGCSDT